MTDMAERLTGENFDVKVLASGKPALIEFYSDGCVVCKKFAPELAEIEEKYDGKIFVGKVNASFDEELAGRFGIMAAPTVILFKDKDPVFRFSGAKKASELSKMIDEKLL